ncbi:MULTISPECIES: HD-GYP domain-containing protein [Pseudomonadati]|uniref:HD domain-containing protein n=1 Tax=Shewanella aestuarii TaxID=1028752 RepID=A0ABT0KXU5_9GAMM|nr:HD domain-containing phosphohydrolase [Shewanella aestuarii]MCL1116220.1 HD domain-containing protein [Shewanella aestuarii]GGN71028.1 metal-dependent phosphohydrolase [Shewanella aestuarii]
MSVIIKSNDQDQIKFVFISKLTQWRKTIFERVFTVLALLCFPVYISSVYLCINIGHWDLVVFDTLVYSLFLLITFASVIPLKVRFILGSTMTYVIGVAYLFVLGPAGAGYFWLFIYPLLSCALLGTKSGYIAQIINFLTLAIIGLFYYYHWLSWPNIQGYSFFIWCVIAIIFMATNIGAMLIFGYLLSITAKNLTRTLNSRYALIVGLATALEGSNPDVQQHIHRVAMYVKVLAEQVSESATHEKDVITNIDNLMLASMLHDVGMRDVPEALLSSEKKLSLDDVELIKRHCVVGTNIIKDMLRCDSDCKMLSMAKDIALYHHENWDGSGYPQNVVGALIPLSARIMRLVDVYDGMTSPRQYKEMNGHIKAVEYITQQSGRLFDANLVRAFLLVEKDFAKLNPKSTA